MIIGLDKTTKTIMVIIIALIILMLCINPDKADETITTKETQIINQSYIYIDNDDTYYIEDNNSEITIKQTDPLYEDEPTITITAKPSCGCKYGYKWKTTTFINYCPHCHFYGTLKNVHKVQARYEQELTCTKCGADYCGRCGKEKYSWSRYYLTRIG